MAFIMIVYKYDFLSIQNMKLQEIILNNVEL